MIKRIAKLNEWTQPNLSKEYYIVFFYYDPSFVLDDIELSLYKGENPKIVDKYFLEVYVDGNKFTFDIQNEFNINIKSMDIKKVQNEAYIYDSKEKAVEVYNYLYNYLTSTYKDNISKLKNALGDLQDNHDEYIKKYNL